MATNDAHCERNFIMKNLKKLKEASGMSQQKLADALYVTQQSIYKYENNLAYPSLETLLLMSNLFSVPIDYIVGNNIKDNALTEFTEILSKDEKRLIEYYRKLSPDIQKSLLDFLTKITKQYRSD